MEISQHVDYRAQLSAVLIRKDGTRIDLGTVSRSRLQLAHFARRLRRLFRSLCGTLGPAAALALIALLAGHGHLPPYSLGLVTTAGVDYMASDFASGGSSPHISAFNYHDSGTGTTAAATGDTALQTSTGNSREAGTQSNPSANIYQSVATLSYTGSAAITEWGLFSASSGGTLWDHRVFSAINVSDGDSIAFTYKLTIAAGGS